MAPLLQCCEDVCSHESEDCPEIFCWPNVTPDYFIWVSSAAKESGCFFQPAPKWLSKMAVNHQMLIGFWILFTKLAILIHGGV
jgi:hypothetical protein